MTIQTLLNLRNGLRAEMGDLTDTIGARTCVSVKEYGAVGTDSSSNATADTAAFLAATAEVDAAGGGAIYVPAGTYWVNAGQWVLPSHTKVFGDGYRSVIKKATNGWLLDISGNTYFGNSSPAQVRNSYCILRDLFFHGEDHTGELLRTYYSSELLVDKCRFAFNAGPAVNGVEHWDSRYQNCFFDWCGGTDTEQPAFYLRNSTSTNSATFGYSPDSTNAIYFYGCRWESFKSHALKLGPSSGSANLAQIFLTSCKMETSFLNGEVIKMSSDCSNVHIDTLFLAINSWNSGYSTATNLIDWGVSNTCSIRNVYAYVGTSGTVRSVVRCNTSITTNTLENIYIAGQVPTLAVVDFLTGSKNQLRLHGYIGGSTEGLGAPSIAKSGGGNIVLAANETAKFYDDNQTYTNATATGYTVTLPVNLYPGWRCKAIQLSTGTITFAAATGGTIVSESGLSRTNGQYDAIEVWCYENNSTLTAPKFHISD